MPVLPRFGLRESISNASDLVEHLREIVSEPRIVAERAKLVRAKLPSIARGLRTIFKTDKDEVLSIGTLLERNAREHGNRPALVYEDRSYTHRELNQNANRYANFYWKRGIRKGDAVAILMENRPEILFAVAGAVKIGAIAAVINTKQRRKVLTHSLQLCKAKLYLVGEELLEPFEEIRGELDNADRERAVFIRDSGDHEVPADFIDGDAEVARFPETTPAAFRDVRLGDPCFYVYTSGTTGLPKASIMSHFRWIKASAAFGQLALDVKPSDIIFVSLPLYHNNALSVTWSSAAAGAACMAISRKFSVTNFWDDVRRYDATMFCYIGELCRYLMNQPRRPEDADNPVRKIIGNGLRPDIWKEFKARFDIDEIYEFYGASECNLVFVNVFNVDCTVGYCPAPYAIVEYDVEADEPVRDAKGWLKKVPRRGTGLLITEISEKYAFDGYTDARESEKKLIRNAFKKGDVWFNTGDLLQDMGFHHAQFVDRIGDTFRWKSENVSTNEVGEVLSGFRHIDEANVYGVTIPHTDGRAGMVAVVANRPVHEFDFAGLVEHLRAELPKYAWPQFLRFRDHLEVTATLKQKKVGLRKEGFDPAVVKDPLYVILPKGNEFVPLTEEIFAAIQAGEVRF